MAPRALVERPAAPSARASRAGAHQAGHRRLAGPRQGRGDGGRGGNRRSDSPDDGRPAPGGP
jgi:hypothetical protein